MKRSLDRLDESLAELAAAYNKRAAEAAASSSGSDSESGSEAAEDVPLFEDAPGFYASALRYVEPHEADLRAVHATAFCEPAHKAATERLRVAVQEHVAAAHALLLAGSSCLYGSRDAVYQVAREVVEELEPLAATAQVDVRNVRPKCRQGLHQAARLDAAE